MLDKLKKHSALFSVCLAIIGSTLIFVSGFFSSNTELEKISEYATNVVVEHTKNKNLCAVTVEKSSDSGVIPDSTTEFHNLYGTFKQEKITFASAVNADKRHNIVLDDVSDNLSFLYCGPVGTIEYNGHFKHYVLPIETMFSDDADVSGISDYIAYISENHANALLEKSGALKESDGTFSEKDYLSLIKQPISVTIDGQTSIFVIRNIYYQSNYYYEGLNDVMGDFIMVSYYLPDNLRSEQQNMYFMSDYTYQNKYFMNYINTVYSSKKYLLKVNHYNIVGEINDDYLLSFYYSPILKNLDWLNSLFIVLSVVLLLASFISLYFSLNKYPVLKCLVNFSVLFVPYLFFYMLYKTTGNVSFLSESSSKFNLFAILIYGIMIVLLLAFRNKININRISRKDNTYYEVDI